MFLVHVNVCEFADTMIIVVQINLIWFVIENVFILKMVVVSLYKIHSSHSNMTI